MLNLQLNKSTLIDIERLNYSQFVFRDLYKNINLAEENYYIMSIYILNYYLDTCKILNEFQFINTKTNSEVSIKFACTLIRVILNLIDIMPIKNTYHAHSSLLCLKLHEYLSFQDLRYRFLKDISIFNFDTKSNEYQMLILRIENYNQGMLF